jgi:hypothetical protein
LVFVVGREALESPSGERVSSLFIFILFFSFFICRLEGNVRWLAASGNTRRGQRSVIFLFFLFLFIFIIIINEENTSEMVDIFGNI